MPILEQQQWPFEKGQVTELGAVNVMTGIFTGRSPKDKYIVKDSKTENSIWLFYFRFIALHKEGCFDQKRVSPFSV